MTIANIQSPNAPPIHLPEHITLPSFEQTTLSNGIPVWISGGAPQELIRVSLMMPAGRWHEPQREVSFLTSRLVKSGTSRMTAAQVEDDIDYYGASLGIGFGNDWSEVTVFALNKHLEPMLTLTQQLLADATFPEGELEHEVAQRKHRLSMSREKVDYLAKVTFLESLHGAHHPYGYRRNEQTLDAVSSDDLRTFFQNHYTPQGAMLFVAGHVGDADMKLLESHLGKGFPPRGTARELSVDETVPLQIDRFVEKKDAVQASIRMGRLMPMPGRPDYAGLRVLNILLGGYFGSRLMLNLRETHGYTYGVRSVISTSLRRAQLTIATEVGQPYLDDSVQQIKLELERLRREPVPEAELTLMRNFTLGALLNSTDGPFRSGQVIKDLVLDGRGPVAFEQYVDTVRTITSQELKRLAEAYLDPAEMTLVVAGTKTAG